MKKKSLDSAFFRVFIFMFLCFAASGCGYTTSSLLPDGMDSIHVDNFVNAIDPTREISDKRSGYSYSPGIENEITRAVIDGFIFDRQLDVDTEKNAALLLKGSLVDIRYSPLSYGDNDEIEEYRVEVFVDMELFDNRTGESVWKEERFMGEASYTVTGPNRKSGPQAQKDAVSDLAQRIVERVVEEW